MGDLVPTDRKKPRDPFEAHTLKTLGKIYEDPEESRGSGWFGESQRHSEAASKGKGGHRAPLERKERGIPPFYVTASPLKENSVFTPRESLDLYRWRNEQAWKKQARKNIRRRT